MKLTQLVRLQNKGGSLVHNTIWNLFGQMIPLIIAVFSIPLLIHHLGTSRFGILTLGWALIGYFGLFDLGIGRALTQVVAEKNALEKSHEIPAFYWASIFFLSSLGIIAAIITALLCPFIVNSILRIPPELISESVNAFYLLAIAMPLAIITAGLRGFLEALQRFDLVNKIRIPMGIMNFLGPLMIILFTKNLFYIMGVLVVIRAIGLIAHFKICFNEMPSLLYYKRFSYSNSIHLLRFGTWMTISNILGPLMTYLDRFLIGALLSVAFVAYYATPYEVVTKLLIIPNSLVCVLFPAFAASFSRGDRNHTSLLFIRGMKYIFLILFPIILIIILFAKEAMKCWLNPEFALYSTHIMQLIAFGIMINGLAQVPFAFLQGMGRPDITAKLHIIEFPIYVFLFWIMVSNYGIDGAAIAWVVRALMDLIMLSFRARKLVSFRKLLMRLFVGLFAGISVLLLGFLISNIYFKGLYVFMIIAVFILAAWRWILTAEEKEYLKQYVSRSAVWTS